MRDTNVRDVFISYSSKDQRVADLVVSAFEERGITCWIAHRDIPGGSSWPLSIPPAIKACRCFLLIFSGNSDASEFVMKEVTLAANSRKPILPFRVEDIQPDRLAFFLADTNWVEAALAPIEEHLEKLGNAVIGNLKTTPGYVPPAPRPEAPSKPKPRPLSAADRLKAHEEREARHLEFLEAARADFVDCEKLDGFMTTQAADKIAAWQGYIEQYAEADHRLDDARARLAHWKTWKPTPLRVAVAPAIPQPETEPPHPPALSGDALKEWTRRDEEAARLRNELAMMLQRAELVDLDENAPLQTRLETWQQFLAISEFRGEVRGAYVSSSSGCASIGLERLRLEAQGAES